MYFYLGNCPSVDSYSDQEYFRDFFAKASPRNIVETVLNINKLDAGKNGKLQIKSKSIPEKLFEKLDNMLKLFIGKLDLADLTNSSLNNHLGNGQFSSIWNHLQDCLDRNNCTEVGKIMESIGNLQYY